MPYKVCAIEQHAFATDSPATTATFNFSTVLKTSPKQRFILKVIGLAWDGSASAKSLPFPHVFMMEGLRGVRGGYTTPTGFVSGVPLGVLGQASHLVSTTYLEAHGQMYKPAEFMLDEIPLDDFKISIKNTSGGVGHSSNFMVQFQIETIEDY